VPRLQFCANDQRELSRVEVPGQRTGDQSRHQTRVDSCQVPLRR
jgi:hypothetical protein